jgi:hypothetical protein
VFFSLVLLLVPVLVAVPVLLVPPLLALAVGPQRPTPELGLAPASAPVASAPRLLPPVPVLPPAVPVLVLLALVPALLGGEHAVQAH